jgi:hypothetical protein
VTPLQRIEARLAADPDWHTENCRSIGASASCNCARSELEHLLALLEQHKRVARHVCAVLELAELH